MYIFLEGVPLWKWQDSNHNFCYLISTVQHFSTTPSEIFRSTILTTADKFFKFCLKIISRNSTSNICLKRIYFKFPWRYFWETLSTWMVQQVLLIDAQKIIFATFKYNFFLKSLQLLIEAVKDLFNLDLFSLFHIFLCIEHFSNFIHWTHGFPFSHFLPFGGNCLFWSVQPYKTFCLRN